MPYPKVLSLCALLLTTGALAANLAIPTSGFRQLQRRDVSVFPRQLGPWTGGADRPLDAATQKQLSSANVLDRIYTDPAGHQVELLIVSSIDPEDAHNPESCLPSQGWKLEAPRTETLDGQLVHRDRAALNGNSLEVLFWWDILTDKNATIFSRMEALRESIRGQGSLMVRVTTPGGEQSAETLNQFAQWAVPAMRHWKQTAPILKQPGA